MADLILGHIRIARVRAEEEYIKNTEEEKEFETPIGLFENVVSYNFKIQIFANQIHFRHKQHAQLSGLVGHEQEWILMFDSTLNATRCWKKYIDQYLKDQPEVPK